MTLSSKSLTDLSLTDLNLMTKEQLIAAITKDRTETKAIVSEGDKRGQLRQIWETRDLAGSLLSTQEVLWTYYPNGNVDTITTIVRDSKSEGKRHDVVKHTESGGLI